MKDTMTELKKYHMKYLDECDYARKLRPETLRGYRAVFHAFTLLMPEVTSVKHLSRGTFQEFFKRLDERTRKVGRDQTRSGVKASTIHTYHSKLNSFCKWLKESKLININPLEKLEKPEVIYNNNMALAGDDLSRILGAIVRTSHNSLIQRRDTALVTMFLTCGLRRSELISLKMTDVDLTKRVLHIRGETSKSKRDRRIPINSILFSHLREYIEERNKKNYKTEYLWVSSLKDKKLTMHGLIHWVKRMEGFSGVRFHLHQFRHTFATRLAGAGINTIKLQKLMGHTDLRMTERYVRSLDVEDLREDVDGLSFDSL